MANGTYPRWPDYTVSGYEEEGIKKKRGGGVKWVQELDKKSRDHFKFGFLSGLGLESRARCSFFISYLVWSKSNSTFRLVKDLEHREISIRNVRISACSGGWHGGGECGELGMLQVQWGYYVIRTVSQLEPPQIVEGAKLVKYRLRIQRPK
jgi:hypothetical protein